MTTAIDSPAGYHGNASGTAFTDEHFEVHKWKSFQICNAASANVTGTDSSFVEDAPALVAITGQRA